MGGLRDLARGGLAGGAGSKPATTGMRSRGLDGVTLDRLLALSGAVHVARSEQYAGNWRVAMVEMKDR